MGFWGFGVLGFGLGNEGQCIQMFSQMTYLKTSGAICPEYLDFSLLVMGTNTILHQLTFPSLAIG